MLSETECHRIVVQIGMDGDGPGKLRKVIPRIPIIMAIARAKLCVCGVKILPPPGVFT